MKILLVAIGLIFISYSCNSFERIDCKENIKQEDKLSGFLLKLESSNNLGLQENISVENTFYENTSNFIRNFRDQNLVGLMQFDVNELESGFSKDFSYATFSASNDFFEQLYFIGVRSEESDGLIAFYTTLDVKALDSERDLVNFIDNSKLACQDYN